jgi:hypothetical protein
MGIETEDKYGKWLIVHWGLWASRPDLRVPAFVDSMEMFRVADPVVK